MSNHVVLTAVTPQNKKPCRNNSQASPPQQTLPLIEFMKNHHYYYSQY